ncbi:MAG: hypothetical protein WBA63_07770 [Thermomicrobiales bacterium]
MDASDHLRQLIDQQQDLLRRRVPGNRQAALLALIRVHEQQSPLSMPASQPAPDLITGHHLDHPGWNKAIQLCLETSDLERAPSFHPANDDPGDWAARFLDICNHLVHAELVLAHAESGFMRLIATPDGTLHAWIASKRAPTRWQERADIDWWARWTARQPDQKLPDPQSTGPSAETDGNAAARYRQLASMHVQRLSYQLGYPSDAVIGGCTVELYSDVLRRLIALALQARDQGQSVIVRSARALVTELAADLAHDPELIAQAVSGFTLDRDNAAWHAAVPGIAAAPLIRVAPDGIILSIHGLTTEPFFFLTRELRRRAAQEYHNAAYRREAVFREDLYTLFRNKRFVTSPGQLRIRRDNGGLRTDIDAVVFDRKTGSLGIFELKSQDPLGRTRAEQERQRDSVLYANRQLSGTLDWLKRYGGDELLRRIDARTAKTFRVHKIFPFVLGRYLAHFNDGPAPDRRAAWGTWPQLLRLHEERSGHGSDANPIASLFTRLSQDVRLIPTFKDTPSRVIPIGATHLIVHPSYAAFRASEDIARSLDP